jgi:hypothetical protein
MKDHSCSLLNANLFPLQEIVPPLEVSALKKIKAFPPEECPIYCFCLVATSPVCYWHKRSCASTVGADWRQLLLALPWRLKQTLIVILTNSMVHVLPWVVYNYSVNQEVLSLWNSNSEIKGAGGGGGIYIWQGDRHLATYMSQNSSISITDKKI